MGFKTRYLCKCHPDFHLPAEMVIGEEFNGYEYARKAKEAGVENFVAFAKCHYGFAYYPTQVGTTHPGLKKDMLGEFVKGCRKEGLGITAYYSVFLDTAAGKKHHDWLMREEGVPVEKTLEGKFHSVCVNSGYLEELLIPQVLEILDRYDIDEILFDTMVDFTPCYCETCRKQFGRPILDSSSPYWLEYVRWYHSRYERFFDRILEEMQKKNPRVAAVINWKWCADMPETPVKHIDRLIGDLFTSGSVSSYYTHYWAGTGLPFDYMCGRFLHGLGDWTCATPETLKYTAASSIANGGGFYLIDRQMPGGTLEDRAYATMRDVFGFVSARREFVVNTEHVPETAVLYPLEHVTGPDFQYFPEYRIRRDRIRQFRGIAKVFMNRAVHYTALNADRLLARLPDYRLLVLPEVEFLGAPLIAAIRKFVEGGGKLLAIQNGYLPHVDHEIMNLAGVAYKGHTDLDYSYIANETEGISDPVLVRGHAAIVEPMEGTDVLARFVKPLPLAGGTKEFGHGFAPATQEEGPAAITRRRYGTGEVIYVAAPLLTSHDAYLSPPIASLIRKLYETLLPEPIVKADCAAHMELTAVRKNNDLIVHLVNHSGKETLAGHEFPVLEYMPELSDIRIFVKRSKTTGAVRCFPDDILADIHEEGGCLKLTVTSLLIMSSICLPGYFNERI